jgi:hypothetical protein
MAATRDVPLPLLASQERVFPTVTCSCTSTIRPNYDRFLAHTFVVTSRGFNALFLPLLALMPWRAALRHGFGRRVLLWAWGMFALLAALHPRRLALCPLGFASALSWSFLDEHRRVLASAWVCAGTRAGPRANAAVD